MSYLVAAALFVVFQTAKLLSPLLIIFCINTLFTLNIEYSAINWVCIWLIIITLKLIAYIKFTIVKREPVDADVVRKLAKEWEKNQHDKH